MTATSSPPRSACSSPGPRYSWFRLSTKLPCSSPSAGYCTSDGVQRGERRSKGGGGCCRPAAGQVQLRPAQPAGWSRASHAAARLELRRRARTGNAADHSAAFSPPGAPTHTHIGKHAHLLQKQLQQRGRRAALLQLQAGLAGARKLAAAREEEHADLHFARRHRWRAGGRRRRQGGALRPLSSPIGRLAAALMQRAGRERPMESARQSCQVGEASGGPRRVRGELEPREMWWVVSGGWRKRRTAANRDPRAGADSARRARRALGDPRPACSCLCSCPLVTTSSLCGSHVMGQNSNGPRRQRCAQGGAAGEDKARRSGAGLRVPAALGHKKMGASKRGAAGGKGDGWDIDRGTAHFGTKARRAREERV